MIKGGHGALALSLAKTHALSRKDSAARGCIDVVAEASTPRRPRLVFRAVSYSTVSATSRRPCYLLTTAHKVQLDFVKRAAAAAGELGGKAGTETAVKQSQLILDPRRTQVPHFWYT